MPVLGLAAVSGTGKTTLLLKVIPLLRARGLRIGLIKRAHHTFDTDKPGKDSYELRKAGAAQVLVGSDHRWALVVAACGRRPEHRRRGDRRTGAGPDRDPGFRPESTRRHCRIHCAAANRRPAGRRFSRAT